MINAVVFRFLRSGLTVRDGKRRRYGHLCTGNRRYRQHYLVISVAILTAFVVRLEVRRAVVAA